MAEHDKSGVQTPESSNRRIAYMRDWIPLWLSRLEPILAPTSVMRYRQEAERNLLPWFGPYALTGIGPEAIVSYTGFLAEVGISRSGQNMSLRILRSCLQHAGEYGLLDHNPAAGIRIPSTAPRADRILRKDEIAALLRIRMEDIWSQLFSLTLLCGLRIGEALALKWEDLEPDQNALLIRRQLITLKEDGPTRFLLQPYTKNRRERRIFLPCIAQEILDARRRNAPRRDSPGLVFCTTRQEPFPYYKTYRRFQSRMRRLNCSGVTPHSLRHTAASIAYAQTLNLTTVQHFLGHRSISSTLRYMHPTEEEQRRAADAISRFYSALQF